MPDMVLNRNFALRSLAGRVIDFEKGIPVHVPPECVREALQIGAEGVDKKLDVLDPEKDPAPELSLEERKDLIKAAFPEMEEKNERGAFTAQGVPSTTALKEITGLEVGAKERDEAWTEYLQEKADNN